MSTDLAAALERIAQAVHDSGALATWTAVDVEMLLRGHAEEARAVADALPADAGELTNHIRDAIVTRWAGRPPAEVSAPPVAQECAEIAAEIALAENAALRAERGAARAEVERLTHRLEKVWADGDQLSLRVIQLRAERDALSTLLRGMARRHVTYRRATTATIADYIREGYDLHRAEIGELRTEIERLAARKWTLADLPDDAARIRDHLTAHGLDTPHGQVLCVVEGAGGLAAAYRRWAGLARRSGPWSDVVAELADVVLSAVVLAARLNIDITQAIADKIGVVNTRGWREVSGDDTAPDEGTCLECQCARPFHKTWCSDPDALAVDAPAEGGEPR